MSHRAAPRSSIPAPKATDGTPLAPPPAGPNITQVINTTLNLTSDDGAQTIIDVIPDMRFMLISWIYSIQHEMPANIYASMPHASPASLLAFTMLQMVALLYFNDSVLRPSMSAAAMTVFNNNVFSSFFAELLTLPVPAFAAPEFAALQAYFDDLASNICFIPSLATTTFLHDYGRHFPASIFLALHNIMAQLPANTTPASLSTTFYNFVVTNVTFNNGTAQVNVTPGMYFGLTRTNNATTAYTNWLAARVDRIVTALAIRPAFTAPTIGPIPVQVTTFTSNDDYNPYLYLSGLNNDNVLSLLQFARSLGQFVNTNVANSRPLSLYTREGSLEATRHLSFRIAGPTWSSNSGTLTEAAFSANTQRTTHRTYLTDINFAGAPRSPATAPDGTNNFFNVESLRMADPRPDHRIAAELRSGNATAADPITYQRNITSTDSAGLDLCNPPCIVFDPTVATTTHLFAVITSGKIIETGNVTSASVLVAQPDLPLHVTNASVLAGMIPFTKVKNSITDGTPFVFQTLPLYGHDSLPQGFTAGHPGRLRIPLARTGIVHAVRSLANNITRFFPGAQQLVGTNYVSHALNYFGYRTNQVPDATAIPDEMFCFWSSYRWTSPTGTRFMIPTLRPIFGLRARNHISQHPSARIP
uniref:Capsid protein n=1 Tax=Rosellinia necatrix partitivirus 20 TaxID=2699388 RepID=A0A6F8QGP2_9VIRU|nr:capsid protein [Rosellinia necatrix partitivirus 20]